MSYGKKMREARKKLGLSQKELAQRSGCSKNSICAWEGEREIPTNIHIISAIETTLNLDTGELYAEIANPTSARASCRRSSARKTPAA